MNATDHLSTTAHLILDTRSHYLLHWALGALQIPAWRKCASPAEHGHAWLFRRKRLTSAGSSMHMESPVEPAVQFATMSHGRAAAMGGDFRDSARILLGTLKFQGASSVAS